MLLVLKHPVDYQLGIYIEATKECQANRSYNKIYAEDMTFNLLKENQDSYYVSHDTLLDGTIPTPTTSRVDGFFSSLEEKGWYIRAENVDKWPIPFKTQFKNKKPVLPEVNPAVETVETSYEKPPEFHLISKLGGVSKIGGAQAFMYLEILNRLKDRVEIILGEEFEQDIMEKGLKYGSLFIHKRNFSQILSTKFIKDLFNIELVRLKKNKFCRVVSVKIHPKDFFKNPPAFEPSYKIASSRPSTQMNPQRDEVVRTIHRVMRVETPAENKTQ